TLQSFGLENRMAVLVVGGVAVVLVILVLYLFFSTEIGLALRSTGDNEAIAKEISAAAGLDGYKAGLLPQQKVEAFEEITNDIGTCVYAGDGINDAPLLACADVGIAMGGVGSDAAIEAADVVLMTDDISKIASAIRISRGAKRIVHENIGMALGIKLAVMIVAAFGAVPMWLAIFADVGVALLAVANSARAIRLK
ncbi:MAG: HAD-IC family P-type ATPase, partial [Oscillospiraceae bacterium]